GAGDASASETPERLADAGEGDVDAVGLAAGGVAGHLEDDGADAVGDEGLEPRVLPLDEAEGLAAPVDGEAAAVVSRETQSETASRIETGAGVEQPRDHRLVGADADELRRDEEVGGAE